MPTLDPYSVRLKIQACGVCHSDSFAVEGGFPGTKFPGVPGHEVVGIIEETGDQVTRLKKGDRVGIGWYAGHCKQCLPCRKGDFIACQKLEVPGITCDGGYAEYGIFREEACAAVPAELSSIDAAPLMCAGITTFNALRHSGARPGDVVAIMGIGGLGHLAVQFANKMGFETIAIARGNDKRELSLKLGARHYVDSEKSNVAEELQKLGGASVALATVTDAKAMSRVIDGLAVDGKLVAVGASMDSLDVSPVQLIMARRSIMGWPSGTAVDSEECMRFCALTGIRPMVEKYSFKDVSQGYQRMLSGKARFRVVLSFES